MKTSQVKPISDWSATSTPHRILHTSKKEGIIILVIGRDYPDSPPMKIIELGESTGNYSHLGDNVDKAKGKILSFYDFGEDWDSYGAAKIASKAIKRAMELVERFYFSNAISPTFVGPVSDGGIVIEYNENQKKISYRIYKDASTTYKLVDGNQIIHKEKVGKILHDPKAISFFSNVTGAKN